LVEDERAAETVSIRVNDQLVPLQVDGYTIYVHASELAAPAETSQSEVEVASRKPSLAEVIGGLNAFARRVSDSLRDTSASRVSIEFGAELAFESGTLVAVVGKASASAAFRVELEWTNPTS
jgi:hypothetical protein